MPKVTLFSAVWWKDVVARGGRQVVQVLIPILALAAGGSVDGIDWLSVGVAAAAAFVVTVVKAVANLSASPDAPLWVQGIERATAAAAGTVAAFMATAGFDLLTADYGALLTAVVGSVGLALTAMVTNPPTKKPAPVPA